MLSFLHGDVDHPSRMLGPPSSSVVATMCQVQQSLQDTEATENLAVPSHH